MKYFVLDMSPPAITGKYLQFEIRITSMSTDPSYVPVMILKINAPPTIYFDVNGNVRTNFDKYDENGKKSTKISCKPTLTGSYIITSY